MEPLKLSLLYFQDRHDSGVIPYRFFVFYSGLEDDYYLLKMYGLIKLLVIDYTIFILYEKIF